MFQLSQLWLKRVVMTIIPALILMSVAASTIWGSNGLRARGHLRRELTAANERLAAVDLENARLIRELAMLESDPYTLERAVAEEISYGRPGTTIYRFDEVDPFATPAAPPPSAPAPAPTVAEPELPAVAE
jgi:cell division protein FtsB